MREIIVVEINTGRKTIPGLYANLTLSKVCAQKTLSFAWQTIAWVAQTVSAVIILYGGRHQQTY